MGVAFFLVLSGFVMSIGYAERVKSSPSQNSYRVAHADRPYPLT